MQAHLRSYYLIYTQSHTNIWTHLPVPTLFASALGTSKAHSAKTSTIIFFIIKQVCDAHNGSYEFIPTLPKLIFLIPQLVSALEVSGVLNNNHLSYTFCLIALGCAKHIINHMNLYRLKNYTQTHTHTLNINQKARSARSQIIGPCYISTNII